jgi:aspartate/methionine/tyrosine aminotransferase
MIRPLIESLPASRIREVANAGIGRTDVLKFWFGEGDQVTPAFIREAAKAALDAGETFYNHNLGIAELREELAAYANRLHGPAEDVTADRVAVTSAGVHALSLIDQTLIDPGDRVVIVTPVWPNLTAMPRIMSADVVRVPLTCRAGAWSLDLQRLLDAAAPGTRMVLVNSPNNPTGWTMPRADWVALLEHCRRHGIWLVSDDAYERIVLDPALTTNGHAPSVLDLVNADDRYVSANTFSKSWTMTGWRLGWLVAPRAFIAQVGKVIEFNTSCAPPFVQQAGLVAVRRGEPLVAATVARLRNSRDLLVRELTALPGVEAAPPPGAMYLFFRIAGLSDDSLACAKRLVAEAGLGIAPGVAFGPEGEGYLRWCFAASDGLLLQGAERLRGFLKSARAA